MGEGEDSKDSAQPPSGNGTGLRVRDGECPYLPTPSHLSCRSLDFINLMAYDFHSSWDKTTGHNSPLYKRQGETGKDAEKNVVSGRWVG